MNRHTRIYYLQNGRLHVLELTNLYLFNQVCHVLTEDGNSFMSYIQDNKHPAKWNLIGDEKEASNLRLQSFIGRVPMLYARFKGEKF